LALAAISYFIPLMLGGIAGVSKPRRSPVEWISVASLVLLSGPASLFATAYFFIGLPVIGAVAALGVLFEYQGWSRFVAIGIVAVALLWWTGGGVWAAGCLSCRSGENTRLYDWIAGGVAVSSLLAVIALSLLAGASLMLGSKRAR
jgi:hypothetical protein